MLDEITAEEIKNKFSKEEFWDFIFETIFDESIENASGKDYEQKFECVMDTNTDGLVDFINMHIRHNISITRKGVRDFVLYMIDAVDNDVELTGMKGVRFQMIVSYLYDMIFESTWQYFRYENK